MLVLTAWRRHFHKPLREEVWTEALLNRRIVLWIALTPSLHPQQEHNTTHHKFGDIN